MGETGKQPGVGKIGFGPVASAFEKAVEAACKAIDAAPGAGARLTCPMVEKAATASRYGGRLDTNELTSRLNQMLVEGEATKVRNAENVAPEIGSWVTCDRDSIPHRLDPFGWGCFCINPVPAAGPCTRRPLSDEEVDKIARGLAEPDPIDGASPVLAGPVEVARRLAKWIEHAHSQGDLHVSLPLDHAEYLHGILVGLCGRPKFKR